MARLRGSPRQASRHSGRQWEKGYQFRPGDEFFIELGPWNNLAAEIDPEGWRSSLADDSSGVMLQRGRITPGFKEGTVSYSVSPNIADYLYVGRHRVNVLGTLTTGMMVIFQHGTNSDISILAVGPSGENQLDSNSSTSISTDGERVDAASWGSDLYFVHEAIGTIAKLDGSAGTFSKVSGSPTDAEFLFLHDNNMVALKDTGDRWEVHWSVDSDPDDWTGTGSGNNPLSTELGDVKGYGFVGDSVIIVCEFGAIGMSSTGTTSPTFRFFNVPGIPGCSTQYAVTSTKDRVYYLGHDRKVHVYQGGSSRLFGGDDPYWSSGDTVLEYSKLMNRLVVMDSTESVHLGDPETNNWAATIGLTGVSHFSDGNDEPTTGITGDEAIFFFSGDANTEKVYAPTEADSSTIWTPPIHVGSEVEVFQVDVTVVDEWTTAPQLDIKAYNGTNTTTSTYSTPDLEHEADPGGVIWRYFTKAIADRFAFKFSSSGPTDFSDITRIRVYMRVITDDPARIQL